MSPAAPSESASAHGSDKPRSNSGHESSPEPKDSLSPEGKPEPSVVADSPKDSNSGQRQGQASGQSSNSDQQKPINPSGTARAPNISVPPLEQPSSTSQLKIRPNHPPSYPPAFPPSYHPSLPASGTLPHPAYPPHSYAAAMQNTNPSFPPSASQYYRPFPQQSLSSGGGGFAVPMTTAATPQATHSPLDSRPSPNAGSPAAHSPSASTSSGKRKRKTAEGSSKSKGAAVAADRTSDEEGDKNKRTKTQRACDPCRRKKIRCDVLQDSEPLICQHCKQYGFECTFYLPISETRFKKKTLAEQAAAAVVASPSQGSFAEPRLERTNSKSEEPRMLANSPTEGSRGEVKIYGPTSLSFIMHSTPSLPVRTFESYDLRYHQTWEVGKSGDGFIQVLDPSPNPAATALPKPVEYRLDRETLASLINAYFKEISPQFPIVSEAEFLSSTSPPPVLLYAVCCVAAARRGVPQEVFDSLRLAVNQVIKAEDVLSTASIVNVQALLILSMSSDVHSSSITNAMTAGWLRLGAAIRMAQDLGLYRAEAVKMNVEMRRRLWGACVIADRWYGAAYGHPFTIDVLDCDVRLPTPDDPNDPSSQLTKPNCYLAELIKLSILLGKVVKTIYSPSGLVHATDQILEDLLGELDQWKAGLHPDLVFKGPQSILPAGLLHLFYTCVCMMFWRVFMRLSYSCPAHLKFSLSVPRWTALVTLSRESIEWLDVNESSYDVWMLVAYSACSCALIQYHTWARRRDMEACESLKKLRDTVQRWEASLQPSHLSCRRKTAEIITLLYEATQIPEAMRLRPSDRPRLNPTVGVHDHIIGTETFRRLAFRKDPSRPGGGVFVADQHAVKDAVSDVPEGTVIVEGEIGSTKQEEGSGVAPSVDVTTTSPATLNPLLGPNLSPLQSTNNYFGMYTGSHPFVGPAPIVNGGSHPAASSQPPRLQAGEGLPSTNGPTNVNPVMNLNYPTNRSGGTAGWPSDPGGGPSEVTVLNFLDQRPVDSTGAYQVLDGIPVDMFSWDGWNEYFTRLSVPSILAGQQHPQHAAFRNAMNGVPPSSSTSGGGANGAEGSGRAI